MSKKRILALIIALVLAICAIASVTAFADETQYSPDTGYTPVQMYNELFNSPKALTSSSDMSTYLTYLDTADGNSALAITPGLSGTPGSHVYLSFRNDTQGSDKIIYVSKTGATSPEAASITDFVTLDVDIGAKAGIPDGMSFSFNGRAYTSATASSPSGNAFIFMKDTNGTLEISGDNVTYYDTGIDITAEYAHLTFILDTRAVKDNGADSILAYAYVNGKYIAELTHGFTDNTDIINEIRVDFGHSKMTADLTDTVLIDNLNVRAFRSGEYNGNLGGVLADSTKTLASFDKNVYTASYKLPTIGNGVIAKIGTVGYTNFGEVLCDMKSTDTVRLIVPTATRPTSFGATLAYYNSSTALQSDGVKYAAYKADGTLLANYTSDADFSAAVHTLQIIGGTIELYADVTSSKVIFSETAANDGTDLGEASKKTTTNARFALNGYTLTPGVSGWFSIATQQGIKNLEFIGPGSLSTTYNTVFTISAGATGSTVSFKDVDISVPNRLITGQKGAYYFENCNITWSPTKDDSNSNLIHGFGGPTRELRNTITFKNCTISANRANATSNTTRGVLIATNTITNSNKAGYDDGVTTLVTFDSCEVNLANCNLLFSNWNTSHKDTMQPTPTLEFIDSNVTAYQLAHSQRGAKAIIVSGGNTTFNLVKLGSFNTDASASITTNSSGVTYTNSVDFNFGEGTAINIKPASATNLNVTLGGKLLTLTAGGYIIENPSLKANVTLNSDFNFNFYIPKAEFVSATVDGTPLTYEEVTLGGVTYVKASYDAIAPGTAGVSKSAVITFHSFGREYTAKYSASIPKYIKLVYNSQDSASVRSRELLFAISLYIDSAYTYFGKTEGKDAIAELLTLTAGTTLPELDASALTAVNTTENLAGVFTSASIALESTPTVRFRLNSAYSGRVTVSGTTYEVENGKTGGVGYIDVSLSAKRFMSTISIEADGKRAAFNTVSYYNYLLSVKDNDADAARALPVIEALFTYSIEAGEFIDHVWNDSYSYNETHHWHACSDAGCLITKDTAEHNFGEDGLCLCGQTIPWTDGDGEFLVALGINKNVKTDLEDMEFAKVLENTSASYSFTSTDKAGVHSGDMLLFSFIVRADASTPIDITVDIGTNINHQNKNKTMTYYAPTQWTRIYMPIECVDMKSVTLNTSGKVYIAEAKFENRGAATHTDLERESGMWMLDEFEYYDVSSSGLGAGATIDLVRSGDYIYSIGGGKLTVTSTKTDKVISTLSGFGTLRQIDVTDDGKYVAITGRQDGVYIVDVEDPAAPAIVSTYNSIEMATGLYISGDYAFICNRQYGVEVVDISDPKNPTHLVNIHSGEVQSCVVYNNILYAGVWGECGVFMYDLSAVTDSSNLEMIGKVTTNGKGDGMSILERDGKIYLFAATGHHTYSAPTSSPLDNLCYGQGNGLDIYDVTDPANAKHISTSKIDGRYYYTANDYWESEVGYDENTGRYYAYLVNTYNGVYVFDVTDIAAPVRVAHIDIPLPLSGTTPALTHSSRAIITTWDQYKSRRSPVGALIIEDGKMYIAGAESDIYVLKNDSFIFGHEGGSDSVASFPNLKDSFYDFDNLLSGGTIANLAVGSYTFIESSGGQTLGITKSGNYVYVAAGKEGVLVLDESTLECVNKIAPTAVGGRLGFANGIKAYDGKLYVASDVAGLRVYDITGANAASPSLLWSYVQSGAIAREVVISPDGIFSLVAHNTNGLWIIDNATHKVVKTVRTSGTMYHHNVSGVISDRYITYYGHSGDEHWLDFGPKGARLSIPTETTFTGGMDMRGGATEVVIDGVSYALKITSNKGVYTNNFTNNGGTQIAGISCIGKPTVIGNYLFVSERISSVVHIYDISYLTDKDSTNTAAVLIGTLTLDGNPDIIYTDGTKAYIPLGYQGILVIDTTTAFKN